MAIAENWNNVFIAEDDLTWTPNFTSGYGVLEHLMRGDYDVIVLGGTFVKSYRNSFKLISCNCALAYIVNSTYYQTLLDCFKKGVNGLLNTHNQSQYAIDQVWKPLQRRDNWYIIKPNMCVQLPSYSNIENKFKDYTGYFNNATEYDQLVVSQPKKPTEYINIFNTLNVINKFFNPNPHVVNDDGISSDSIVFQAQSVINRFFNPRPHVVTVNVTSSDSSFFRAHNVTNKFFNPQPRIVVNDSDNNNNNDDTSSDSSFFRGHNVTNRFFTPQPRIVNESVTSSEVVVFQPFNLTNKVFNPQPVISDPVISPPSTRVVSFKSLLRMLKMN